MSERLVVSSLRVSRGGREVVHGVDLTARAGSVTALLGANGAGKSSLVLALAGVLAPDAGTVLLDGTDVTRRNPTRVRAAGLATVPEGHRVLRDLTVADNLRTAALLLPRGERDSAVEEVLSLFVELRALTRALAGTLSGGQQQMLALGQALVARPRVLIVDEMSLGLAPVVVRRLAPALADIAASGVAVLLIEQFTQIALKLASDAYAMASGRVVLHEDTARLRAEPQLLERAYRLGDEQSMTDGVHRQLAQ